MKRRSLLAAALALPLAGSALLGAPPVAAESFTVTVSPDGGTRQFSVEDLAGNPLTAIDFGRGGAMPFKVKVVDDGYSVVDDGYQISATMTNLYRVTETGYDYSTRIPSSAVRVQQPATPIDVLGPAIEYVPQVALSGTVQSCTLLQSLGGVLGNLLLDPAAKPLCDFLGLTGRTVSTTVDGLTKTIQLPAASLADLPIAPGGAQSGAFTNADMLNGIGAGDPAGGPAATAISLLTGSPSMTSQLSTAIRDALGGLQTITPGQDGLLSLPAVLGQLEASSDSVLSRLGSTLGLLGDATKQLEILNRLTATLGTPALTDIVGLTGSHVSQPTLVANAPGDTRPGTYQGTLTVTYVQS